MEFQRVDGPTEDDLDPKNVLNLKRKEKRNLMIKAAEPFLQEWAVNVTIPVAIIKEPGV